MTPHNERVRRYGMLWAALIACWASGCSDDRVPQRIGGGGATSIEPLINAWQPDYFRSSGVQVDYIGTGSGNGAQQMIRRAIVFGCTDSPLNAEQLSAARAIGGEVVHLPLAITGVVPICNIPGLAEHQFIQFSGEALAGIYLGEITRWNDPALVSLNADVPLPDLPIKVVSRSEPSGTTAIFADYLARARPENWQQNNMGQGPSVAFAVGIRQKGNPGVAGEVRRNPGAIGYVELTYAAQMGGTVTFGAVRNRHGLSVRASPASITAAAASIQDYPDDLCFSLIDAPGVECYPICGAVWAAFYRNQSRRDGQLLVDFLRWATSKKQGQALAPLLGYAPLPNALIERVGAKLNGIVLE